VIGNRDASEQRALEGNQTSSGMKKIFSITCNYKRTPTPASQLCWTSQCANNQSITGPVTHYNGVSTTFTSKKTKQDHASFFSKL